MKPYGEHIPFYRKRSGWWPWANYREFRNDNLPRRSAQTEEKQRARRWIKRLERRVGKYMIEEQLRETDPKKIHV